jgi:hypothetical protein
VLANAQTGAIQTRAAFTDIQWASDKTSFSAVVDCLNCKAGRYMMHLGETLSGLSAVITESSDVILELHEQPCRFVNEFVPPELSTVAFERGAVPILLPVDLMTMPRQFLSVSIGTELHAPISVKVLPSAHRDQALLSITPSGVAPLGTQFITVAVSTGSIIISACTVDSGFTVTESDPTKPEVFAVTPRVFLAGAGDKKTKTVRLTGSTLERTKAVKLHFQSSPAKVEDCAEVAATPSLVTCVLHDIDSLPTGEFDFVLIDISGKEAVRVPGMYRMVAPRVAFEPSTATAGTPTRVVVTLDGNAFPGTVPLDLVLFDADGTEVKAAAQWGEGNTAVFVEAIFSSAGEGYVAVREPMSVSVSPFRLAGSIQVDSGAMPKASLVAVYPSYLQLDAISQTEFVTFRLDVENTKLLDEKPYFVRFGGHRLFIEHFEGALTVRFFVPREIASYDVEVCGTSEKVLLSKRDAIVVEGSGVAPGGLPITIPHTNYAVFIGDDDTGVVTVDVHNAPRFLGSFDISKGSVTHYDTTVMDGKTRISIHIVCQGCWINGEQVVATFNFPNSPAIRYAFMITRRVEVRRLWPEPTIAFMHGPACVPYSLTLAELNPRMFLTLAFVGNPLVKDIYPHFDEATSTLMGCLVCEGCTAGKFTAALVAPYTNAETMAEQLSIVVDIVPRQMSTVLVAPAAPRPDEPRRAFGSSTAIGIAAAAAAAGIALAIWRYLSSRHSKTGKLAASTVDSDTPSESSYSAI